MVFCTTLWVSELTSAYHFRGCTEHQIHSVAWFPKTVLPRKPLSEHGSCSSAGFEVLLGVTVWKIGKFTWSIRHFKRWYLHFFPWSSQTVSRHKRIPVKMSLTIPSILNKGRFKIVCLISTLIDWIESYVLQTPGQSIGSTTGHRVCSFCNSSCQFQRSIMESFKGVSFGLLLPLSKTVLKNGTSYVSCFLL